MNANYVQSAFDAICKDAVKAEGHYVVLMESQPFYGGPEEGGWWGRYNLVRAYQFFPTALQAEVAKLKVEELARELSVESKRQYGEQCLRESEWLEARGLDDDFLPQPDGESEFYVVVTDQLPENSYGTRHYK